MSDKRFVVLTGASGAGKTVLAERFASLYPDNFSVQHFDVIQVPSRDEMVSEYGSVEAWQWHKTNEWFSKLVQLEAPQILFEGQSRIAFLTKAIVNAGITDAKIVLVDCDDAARTQRLKVDRGQSDAEIEGMLDWAEHLRKEAASSDCEVLDTSSISVDAGAEVIRSYFR